MKPPNRNSNSVSPAIFTYNIHSRQLKFHSPNGHVGTVDKKNSGKEKKEKKGKGKQAKGKEKRTRGGGNRRKKVKE